VRGGRACDVCATARSSQQLQGHDRNAAVPGSGSAVLCGPIRLSGLCVRLSVDLSACVLILLYWVWINRTQSSNTHKKNLTTTAPRYPQIKGGAMQCDATASSRDIVSLDHGSRCCCGVAVAQRIADRWVRCNCAQYLAPKRRGSTTIERQ
jgi:hypothetical protein